ncbi:MAG: acyl-homoserine-lactone acylase [Cytophagaceae bacterium SCN 52-12]|nr:MAG: acyl-homoserine-lactone acylase [Cytophagaceae bacterium SCN 52-12]
MRLFPFLLSSLLTLGLLYILNNPLGDVVPMPLGAFLSPQHGFWQNADPADADFSASTDIPGLRDQVEIFLDDRLVPHIFAQNEEDLYAAQGYVHARFRLFQMDLQTRAAAGRASEFAGPRAVDFDRSQRRLGMVYAAENALAEMEKDPLSKKIYDAYTRGVNAYIASLSPEEWPVEYKLLNVSPEPWSNLRTALLLKMMAKMLTGGADNDLGYTNAKAVFSADAFDRVYQVIPDSLRPIVPEGTAFPPASVNPVAPATADSLYFNGFKPVPFAENYKPDPHNGSNNWALAGSKTLSGAPILANDPHLELSLPSIWFEIQLTDHSGTSYGASLPGSPFVISGFNDHIAWGITNAQRDVRDYFEIKFRDGKKDAYWYKGAWKPSNLRIEEIKVKGGETVYDTVAYTVFGPVMFEAGFPDKTTGSRNLAVRWTGHDGSDEGITFYRLNRAKNYLEYADAIRTFTCPAQNFIFASKTGDIAVWQQGKFPARWHKQGLFVMPGQDDAYQWQAYIPQNENPHAVNPARGFLESANQRPADATYPYYIPGAYITARGISIEQKLDKITKATPEDIRRLLSDYDNVTARAVVPALIRFTSERQLDEEAKRYLNLVKTWDFQADPGSEAQTVYQVWMDSLRVAVWNDELLQVTPKAPMPDEQVLVELLLKDSASVFYDDINTPARETARDVVTSALNKAAGKLAAAENEGKLEWAKFKNTSIFHLLKEALPSFARRGLPMGGYGNTINAVTVNHGPSWRMVVHLTDETEAYGVYPAGQNGNPGSRYYDNFVDTWVKGEMYKLWVMRKEDAGDARVKWTIALRQK